MIKLLETELRKLVMDGKVHPNTAREALDKLEASQNLQNAYDKALTAIDYREGYYIIMGAVKQIL